MSYAQMDHQLIALHIIAFILWHNHGVRIYEDKIDNYNPWMMWSVLVATYATVVGIAYLVAHVISKFF